MKLLVVTQAIDKQDPVLSFFSSWIKQFKRDGAKIELICLKKGQHDLGENTPVHSLGKERGVSKLGYILNFYKYIFALKKNYDSVLVHMNQEYVLLGALPWLLMGKKVFLWRNHPSGSFLTRLAVLFSTKVFCTSDKSFTFQFKKTKLMPAGIDTDLFRPRANQTRKEDSILYVGRISPIKHLEVLMQALLLLQKEDFDFQAEIIGEASEGQNSYHQSLLQQAGPLLAEGRLKFLGPKPQPETVHFYNTSSVCVNATESGSFDKTVIEAMACRCIPIFSNSSFASLFNQDKEVFQFQALNFQELAERIKKVLSLESKKKEKLRDGLRKIAIEKHSLKSLSEALMREISE